MLRLSTQKVSEQRKNRQIYRYQMCQEINLSLDNGDAKNKKYPEACSEDVIPLSLSESVSGLQLAS
jgi:hypothetical protein